MAVTMKMNTVFKSEADRMREKDLEGKIIVGEFADKQRPDYTDNIQKLSEAKSGGKTLRYSAYMDDI